MTFIKGETVLFDESQKASLAFPPTQIDRIYNLPNGVEYDFDKDIVWTPGNTQLIRTATSAVPYLTHDDLYVPAEHAILFPKPGANAISGGINDTLLRLDNGNFFARHQLEVDYWTDEPMPHLVVQREKLPNFRSNHALKLAFIGDSITVGGNASKFVGVTPFQPAYAELLAAKLHPAQMHNFAVGGTNSDHGIQHLDAWLDEFCPARSSLLMV